MFKYSWTKIIYNFRQNVLYLEEKSLIYVHIINYFIYCVVSIQSEVIFCPNTGHSHSKNAFYFCCKLWHLLKVDINDASSTTCLGVMFFKDLSKQWIRLAHTHIPATRSIKTCTSQMNSTFISKENQLNGWNNTDNLDSETSKQYKKKISKIIPDDTGQYHSCPLARNCVFHSVTLNQRRTRILIYKHQEVTTTHILCPAVLAFLI